MNEMSNIAADVVTGVADAGGAAVAALQAGGSPLQAAEAAGAAAVSDVVKSPAIDLPGLVQGLAQRIDDLEARVAAAEAKHPVIKQLVGIIGKFFPSELAGLAGLL